jgi:hypothetical protein
MGVEVSRYLGEQPDTVESVCLRLITAFQNAALAVERIRRQEAGSNQQLHAYASWLNSSELITRPAYVGYLWSVGLDQLGEVINEAFREANQEAPSDEEDAYPF